MPILPMLIILELLTASILLAVPYHGSGSGKNVLGATYIADDQTQTTVSEDTPTPTPDATTGTTSDTPMPIDTSLDTPKPTDQLPVDQQVVPTQMPQDTSGNTVGQETGTAIDPSPLPTVPQDETNLLDTNTPAVNDQTQSAQLSPTPISSMLSPEEITTGAPILSDSPSPSLNPSPSETADVQTQTDQSNGNTIASIVTNPDAVIADTSQVNAQVVTQAQQQDTQIQKATANPDTEQHTQTLLHVATDNIVAINTAAKDSQYATSSFLTQRVIDEVSKTAINNQKLSYGQQVQQDAAVQSFCQHANLALQTEQLLVPENLEQDLAIVSGFCKTR